jgi:hypothetical protein
MKVFSLTASACEEASEARLRAFYDRPQAEINMCGGRLEASAEERMRKS